jgi:hypothetical protein
MLSCSFPRHQQMSADTGSVFTVSPSIPGDPPPEIPGIPFGQ